jgi:anti-sigma regulatory factor (Ser/Thr protein kinase)
MPATHRLTSARSPGTTVQGEEGQLTLAVSCDKDAPAAARELIRELAGAGSEFDDAVLIASELVSNAVLHSGARADDQLTVEVALRHRRVLITVVDPGRSGTRARVRSPGDGFSGFGLRLVDELADRWGSERTALHRVWAEVALPR